jgi:hypothetical protein
VQISSPTDPNPHDDVEQRRNDGKGCDRWSDATTERSTASPISSGNTAAPTEEAPAW